jgi:aspartate aminotransferase-like enzyme
MIPHRGPAFKTLYQQILANARRVHRTDGDILVWSGTGSAGWEVAIVNLLSPGDPVLATICGNFGERFARVGEAFGLDVRRLDVPWGEAITGPALREALTRHPEVKAVFLTHNETSTGLTNPLPELAAITSDHGALVIVDAVSSAAAIPLQMDDWGLDFVLSGSQKAWMCPPGLLITAIGGKAWDAHTRSRFPRFFWDITAARETARQGFTPTTPSLTLLYAYDAALRLILDEGLEQVWARHHALGEMTRSRIAALGLDLFPNPDFASDTVTAFRPPPGVTASELLEMLRRDHQVEAQSGQAHLADAIVRFGHMGWAHEPALNDALDALGAAVTTATAAGQSAEE